MSKNEQNENQNINLNIDPEKIVCDWMSSSSFIPMNKSVAHKIGVSRALVLAEVINQYKRWKSEGKLRQGMFYFTEEDCEAETTYSKSSQARIFEKLEEYGLMLRHKLEHPNAPNKNKTTRYIELFFGNIAKLMFESDDQFRNEIEEKYKIIKSRDEKHKQIWLLKRKSQNETSGKSQNETYNNKSSSLSNKSNSLNNNLSIYEEEIEKLDVPVQLKKVLKENDRWMDHSISLGEIERNYKYHQETISVEQYISAFEFALKQEEIGEFEKIMARNVEKQLEFKNNRQSYDSSNSKQEHLPDWFKEQKEQEQGNQKQSESLEEVSPEQIQKEKEEILKSIKARSQKKK